MKEFWSLFSRNRLSVAGLILLILIIMITLAAPLLPLADPTATNLENKFLRPFTEGHFLGTDEVGRDILSRLIWGTRVSLTIGIVAAFAAAFIGSLIGLFAGYYGGRIDNIFMRSVDMLMAFPYILLALAIVAALGPGLRNALIAVVIVNIPFFARNIRGVVVTFAKREFVEAAKLSGMSNIKIIFSEILPNVLPIIVIAMSTTLGWMILETAGLSFLGLGSQPPQSDLGSMLGQGRNVMITDPHASIIPGIMIFLIVMSVNLLGDGVRDALDPRLKSGALSRPMARTKRDMPNHHPKEQSKTIKEDNSLLSIQKLSTEFRVKNRVYKAVNQIDFNLKAGECLGVVGESGSGKSVTALSIMGLVASPPGVITSGGAYFKDEDLIQMDDERLVQMRGKKVAYIFQDPLATLHPLYKIGDQLIEAMQIHDKINPKKAQQKALDLLKSVRIPNPESRIHNYPHELSGGMRQRISIAMALANDPEIIIADEPTTALDVTVQAQILTLLSDLRKARGLSIIFITHDFGVVAQLCDRVGVMYAGQFVEFGETRTILETPRHPYTKRLMQCVPELGGGRGALTAIKGLPPMVDNLPKGCAFAQRCIKANEACKKQGIMLENMDGQYVRCINPEEIS